MNASRMKVAGSKKDKDRPKSSDKLKKGGKRDGTPDKPTTPGPDDENGGDSRPHVLNDEEIQSLAIKQDTLTKIRQDALASFPPPKLPKNLETLNVRKVNKNPPPKIVTKSLTVAKGAPPRAALKPVETEGKSGPRFDSNGNVVKHSILGTLEEYKTEAEKKGELTVDYYIRDEDRVQTPTLIKRQSTNVKPSKHPEYESVDKSNALINWQKKMNERKMQQGYISKLLQKPVEQLVMNQGDTYREKQEIRYAIDRSIPAVDYGKGYRVGSEFWEQRPLIGDEDTGLYMTLNQSAKGYPPPIEHVRVPRTVQMEKGIDLDRPSTSLNKPWHKSNFLRERVEQLGPVIQDLDPHIPDVNSLEIIGSSNPYYRYVRAATPISERGEILTPNGDGEECGDPLAKHPDVYTPPAFGPCIKFAGQVLEWTGDGHSSSDKIAVDARVTFEAYAGCRSTSVLEIINLGTTAIYFSWKMLPKSNPFDLVNANTQRFYFNTSSGVILPGDTLRFPFVFKSEKAGVFNERWQLQTHPVVAGGAALVVTLRGVSLREDKLKKQRELIETKLQKNIIEKNIRRLVDDIVDSIKSPERPKSPVDSYLTIQDVFMRQNPQLYYKHDVVERLSELYKMMVDPPSMDADENGDPVADATEYEVPEWNLNIAEFKRSILEMDSEDERKPAFLENINEAVMQLSFPDFNPRLRKLYQACYQYVSNSMDYLGGQSIYLRQLLGLPEKETEDKADDSRGKTAASKATPKTGSKDKDEKKSGKVDAKKDAKGKDSSTAAGKKNDRASPTKKTPPTKSSTNTATLSTSNEGRITPATDEMRSPSTMTGSDVVTERKYREKLTAQVYMDINELVNKLVDVFEEINSQESGH